MKKILIVTNGKQRTNANFLLPMSWKDRFRLLFTGNLPLEIVVESSKEKYKLKGVSYRVKMYDEFAEMYK